MLSVSILLNDANNDKEKSLNIAQESLELKTVICNDSSLDCLLTISILNSIKSWSEDYKCISRVKIENYTQNPLRFEIVQKILSKNGELNYKMKTNCELLLLIYKPDVTDNNQFYLQISIFKNKNKVFEDNLIIDKKKAR